MGEVKEKSMEQLGGEIKEIMKVVEICDKEKVDYSDFVCPACGGRGSLIITKVSDHRTVSVNCQEGHHYHLRLAPERKDEWNDYM